MKYLLSLLTFALVSPIAHGAELKGVEFPEQAVVGSKKLILNGLGVLKKTMFKVDVFVAGLYVEKPKMDETALLRASQETKKLVLVFLRDATADQIIDSWREGFERTCSKNCEQLDQQLNELSTKMVDIKKGQEVKITFLPDRVMLTSHGRRVEVKGQRFAQAMLGTLIDRDDSDSEFNTGIMGRAQFQG